MSKTATISRKAIDDVARAIAGACGKPYLVTWRQYAEARAAIKAALDIPKSVLRQAIIDE